MGTDAAKHVIPAGSDGARRQTLLDLIFSAHDVIPVANATERDTVYAALVAAGRVPASAPVIVDRFDTGALERNAGSGFQLVGSGPAARATKTTAQNTNASAGVAVTVSFDTEAIDTDAMHSTGQPTRLTCVQAGCYRVFGKASVQATGVGYITVLLAKNGVSLSETMNGGPGPAAGYARASTGELISMNVGDYVELLVASSAVSTALVVGECLLEATWDRPLP